MTLRLPRNVRTRLLAIVVVTVGVALGAALLLFNGLLAQSTRSNAKAFLRARASTELAVIHISHGTLQIGETRNDTLGDRRVWIYRDRAVVQDAESDPVTQAAARSLAGATDRYLNVASTDVLLYAVPIAAGGRRLGTLVTGVSLAPYESTRRTAAIASATLFVTLLLLVTAAAWWLLRTALRPVARMTDQAAAWSERDLDRRFALGEPHDELTLLAVTLDGLLDRIAASIRHERRFSAELAHELRTPLAKLMAEVELTLRRERSPSDYRNALTQVMAAAQRIEGTVEALIAAERQAAEPRGVANAREVAYTVANSYARDAIEVTIDVDSNLRLGVDAELAERILHPVVENAFRYTARTVRISAIQNGSAVAYSVLDDGPGITDEEREAIFEPARRGSAATGPGAGLGLALARRLARTTNGEVTAEPGRGGHFTIHLPPG
jgi:signal transduction histidine kinase